ncbi:MAG TPA: enoyl-CoA hydratase-related protein [Acidimicrobiales bacterium]|nr:enoyl-CoA hydratase-related protein [Acidimicrobiales bacterium]
MADEVDEVDEALVLTGVGEDGVATLTLNRPAKRNALDDRMIHLLLEGVDELARDPAAKVIVVRGAGPSFCAGADMSGAAGGPDRGALDDRNHMLDERYGQFLRLWDAPKPVIAQVHGHCLGIAVALCSCADLVVVADDATVGWPLPLGGGVIGPAMALYVGLRRAKELSFVPMSSLTGREAAELGWANRSVPAAELDATVAGLAAQIARVPSGVLRMKKEAINAVYERAGFREAVRSSASFNALAHTDPDLDEVRAVLRERGVKGAGAYFQG